jgi:hypothetical protein
VRPGCDILFFRRASRVVRGAPQRFVRQELPSGACVEPWLVAGAAVPGPLRFCALEPIAGGSRVSLRLFSFCPAGRPASLLSRPPTVLCAPSIFLLLLALKRKISGFGAEPQIQGCGRRSVANSIHFAERASSHDTLARGSTGLPQGDSSIGRSDPPRNVVAHLRAGAVGIRWRSGRFRSRGVPPMNRRVVLVLALQPRARRPCYSWARCPCYARTAAWHATGPSSPRNAGRAPLRTGRQDFGWKRVASLRRINGGCLSLGGSSGVQDAGVRDI